LKKILNLRRRKVSSQQNKCLIDADVIAYEISSCGEYKDENGEHQIRDFEFVAGLADQRIRMIEEVCMATEPSTLFFTADETLIKAWNKFNDPIEYKENFRVRVAKSKPYKGTRQSDKPYHFHNLRAYLLASHDSRIANGCEADDLICVELQKSPANVACSRDKDLRQVNGRHYAWPCGAQEEWGPALVEGYGDLYEDEKGKVRGTGDKFFFYQMLIGDTVDNIPGLPGCGPKKAFAALKDTANSVEGWELIKKMYESQGEDYLWEQYALLYICREEEDLSVGHLESLPAATTHGRKLSLETS
jgi:hypothetical protein